MRTLCLTAIAVLLATVVLTALALPALAEDNLLKNPSFEEGTVGDRPPGWRQAAYDGKDSSLKAPLTTEKGGHTGDQCAAVEVPAGYQWSLIEQGLHVPADPSKRLVLSAWLRSDDPEGRVDVAILVNAPKRKAFNIAKVRLRFTDIGPEWKRYEAGVLLSDIVDLQPDDDLSARAVLQVHAPSQRVYVDDVSFRIVPSEEGFLPNGDAEAGEVGQAPPNWVPFGYKDKAHTTDFPFETTSGGRNGSKAIAFECPPGYTWTYVQHYVPVTIDPSKRTVLSMWMRSDKPLSKVGYHLYMTPKGQKEGGFSRRSAVQVGPEWKRYEIAMEFPLLKVAEGTEYNLRPIVQLHSPGARIEIDDAELRVEDSALTSAQLAEILDVTKKTLPPDAITVQAPIGITGGIVPLDDGTLLAFTPAFGVRRSTDGGKTWGKSEPLAITDKFNKITGSIQMRNGTIGIHTESWGKPMYFWKSADSGKTWTKRIQIGPKGAPLHGNVMIETSDGRLLVPVREGHTIPGRLRQSAGGTVNGEWVLTEGHGHNMEMDITFVYYSTDGGNKWRRSSGDIVIWKDDGYGGMWPVDEPNIAQLRDGRLIMLVRTTLGRLYQTFSSDGGATWDYPTETELPSSYSPCSLERIPENEHTLKAGRAGDLLVVWNNVSVAEIKRGFRRGRLSCAISKDDGKTWIHVKTVDTAGLPAIKGIAPLSEPQMARADKDLGELPIPFGGVDYPDITFAGDKVLIKYAKKLKNPAMGMGAPMHILPIDWLYQD